VITTLKAHDGRSTAGFTHKPPGISRDTRCDWLAASVVIIKPAAAQAVGDIGWQRRIRRIGQLNMTEHDPVEMNVEEWADYWASLKVDAVLVSVTGILAFYQTKVPFHRKGKYLGERDFFGECCAAAKKRGLHVVARDEPRSELGRCAAGSPGVVPAR
jgi:hypothetical protein